MRNQADLIENISDSYNSEFNIKYKTNTISIRCFTEHSDVSENLSRSELEKLRTELKFDKNVKFREVSEVISFKHGFKILIRT